MDKKQINYPKPERHDLLYLDGEGRSFALESRRPCRAEIPDGWIEELILSDVPAIVRRQEEHREGGGFGEVNGFLDVGFSSHRFVDGVRLRVAAKIPIGGITKIIKPTEVFELILNSRSVQNLRHEKALLALSEPAKKNNVEIGIYGSMALYVLSGKDYVTENSDVDIYIKTLDFENLESFYADAKELSTKENISFDIELDIGDGYAVKLKEYLSKQKTAIAKGLYDVKLVNTYRK